MSTRNDTCPDCGQILEVGQVEHGLNCPKIRAEYEEWLDSREGGDANRVASGQIGHAIASEPRSEGQGYVSTSRPSETPLKSAQAQMNHQTETADQQKETE